MKTKRFLFTVLAFAGLMSCQQPEEAIVSNVPAQFDLTTTIETVEGLSWSFASNDEITIFDGKNVNQFVTADGGSSAVFSGLANKNADALMAVYPSTTKGRYQGKVDATVPSVQNGVNGGVDKSNLVLAAYKKNDGQNVLDFKNMLSFVKIVIAEEDDIVSVELKSNAGEKLSGAVNVGLFESPTIEALETSSQSVTLSGDPLAGTYYFAVIPQTLTQGYTMNFINSDDFRSSVSSSEEIVFERAKITEISFNADKLGWVPPVNPNPTNVPSVAVVKAGFEEAPFNMVSEGSFEYFPDQDIRFRTPWIIETPWATAVPGHDGTPALGVDLAAPIEERGGWHRNVQVCALRQHTNYVYSAWATCTHGNTYFSCQTWPSGINREISGFAWGPVEEWKYISHVVNPQNDILADVIQGAWWEPIMKIQYDEISLIPEGYTAMSTAPKSASKVGGLTNGTFDQIDALGKIVAWKNSQGKLCFILSDFTVNGVHYDTAVALTESTDLTQTVNITQILKKRGQFIPISVPGDGVVSIVPNDVFVLNGKTYLHYYAKKWQNPDNADDWTVDHAGFLVSEDDGLTWTQSSKKWRGDGTFCSASFAEKDGILYMLGTNRGRQIRHGIGDFHRSNFYVARISTTKDFTDPNNWEYFNCREWHTGEPVYTDDGADHNRLVMGSRGECALIWNPKFQRFMMIYRDGRQEGLVYRDAGNVDEAWSGEKPLAYDDLAAGIYAPSVIDVTADGELIIVASQLN